MEYHVIIPEWEWYYTKSKETRAKYWLWKDKDKLPKKHLQICDNKPKIINGIAYCVSTEGERFIKNSKTVGKENIWVLNGQDLYSAVLNWRLRKTIAIYYHRYFGKYIKEQLQPIKLNPGEYLSISCDIYIVKRGHLPDVSNMWLLEKFFEDALQDYEIIDDDDYNNVIESGRKRYHFVNNHEESKLIFTIKILTL